MNEPDVGDLMTVAQAMAAIDATPVVPRVEMADLDEGQGLRLAEDLLADRDYPPFDKSQMDGIACQSADVQNPNTQLKIIGEIPAGAWPSRAVAPGQAMRIMTGAPLPAGADTVIPVEFLITDADHCRVTKVFKPGNAIARQASEVRAGERVLARGTKLGPAQLAVAATIGAAHVKIFHRPKIAVLTTGDEVVHFSQSPPAGRIRNSNSLLLSSLLWNMGCDVTDLGIAPDRPDILRQALREGVTYDALFVTGGMSMGDYDYVPAILREIGVELKITRIKIKPGKPFVFGTYLNPQSPSGMTFVFGLPGNPVSTFVCTILLASRLIARLTGGSPNRPTTTKKLATPLPANGPREFYQPVRIDGDIVHTLAWKGSADVFTLATANGLLRREENEAALMEGADVVVIQI